jgi:uncharacterized protein YggE
LDTVNEIIAEAVTNGVDDMRKTPFDMENGIWT